MNEVDFEVKNVCTLLEKKYQQQLQSSGEIEQALQELKEILETDFEIFCQEIGADESRWLKLY